MKSLINFDCIGKTLDNTSALTLKRFRFEDDSRPYAGKYLKAVDNAGTIHYASNSANSVGNISIFMGADDNDPFQSTTLYGAYQKALAMSPSFEQPVNIFAYPGTYYETQKLIWDTDLVAINGFNAYYLANFILTVDLGADPWIDITSTSGEFHSIFLDGASLCDTVVRLQASTANSGIDMNYCWFKGSRVTTIDVDGGLLFGNTMLSSITGDDQGFGTAVIVQNYGFYDAQIHTVFVENTPDNYTYFKLITGGSLFLTNDYTSGGLYYIDASGVDTFADVFAGSISGFSVAIKVSDFAQVRTRNVNFKDNVFNNDVSSDSLWLSCGDISEVHTWNTTNLTAKNFSSLFSTTQADDSRGMHIYGRLSVGDRYFPTETWMGHGCCNLQNYKFFQYDGSTFYDQTTAGGEVDAPTAFPIFQGNTTSNYIVIGDDKKFSSIDWDISTAAIGGVISVQYWTGAGWSNINYMFSNLDYPYTAFGSTPWSIVGQQVMRFDHFLLETGTWNKTTVNGELKYWIMISISTIFTTVPQINFIKLYGNSSKVTTDGNILHYGLACTNRPIPFDVNLCTAIGGSILSQDLFYSQNLRIGRVNNKLAKNKAISGEFVIPADFNSSCKLILKIAYSSDSNAISQPVFQMTMYIGNILESSPAYTTSGAAPLNYSTQVTVNGNLPVDSTGGFKLQFADLGAYLPTAISADASGNAKQIIAFTLNRNNDTNANNLVINQITPYYTSYRTTGIAS